MLSVRYTIAVLLLVTNLVMCQRNPTISFISKPLIIDTGGIVTLVCSVQYSQGYPVIWTRLDPTNRNNLFISTGSTRIVPDDRFSIRHDSATSEYTLTITSVQQTDNGTYQCQVPITTTTKISADVSVMINLEPVISDNSTRSVIAREKDRVMLECYADGFPKPNITWRRENSGPLPTGGSIYRGNRLLIKSVTKEDRGTYFCVAQNGVGRGQKRNVNVEVEFAPDISVRWPVVNQALQYDAELRCSVDAYPPPAITWHKDGYALNNNQHYSISIWNSAGQTTSSTLRILTAEKRQFSTYECRASNVLGTASSNVRLNEVSVPVCPPACDLITYGGAMSVSATLLILLAVCFPLLA